MTEFSQELIAKLQDTQVTLSPARPRLLLGPADVERVRARAKATPGAIDKIAERARAASQDENLFGSKLKYPLITHQRANPLKPLATAALVLEDEGFAARALEGIEIYYRFPDKQWLQPSFIDAPTPYTLFHPTSGVGFALDLCTGFWTADALTGNRRGPERPITSARLQALAGVCPRRVRGGAHDRQRNALPDRRALEVRVATGAGRGAPFRPAE
jgi:hypothetical protein